MAWVDVTIYMIIDAESLIKMSEGLGRKAEVKPLEEEKEALLKYLTETLWDKERKFFFDRYSDGTLGNCKSVVAFWALHIDELPKDMAAALIEHLKNKDEFNRFNPVPSISADSYMYDPNGKYWRGGVWPCMNYGVFSGLVKKGYSDLAFELAKRHNQCVCDVFHNPTEEHKKHAKSPKEVNTLWECYAPDSNDFSSPSLPEFVGWSALSTISILFEFVFGIIPRPTENTIIWNVNLTDEFGIEKYPINGKTVDLKCKRRADKNAEPEITVIGDVKVIARYNGKEKVING